MQRTFRGALAAAGATAIVGAMVATLVVGNGSGPVRAATSLDSALAANTVSVNGLGKVMGTPDVLSLQLGVERNGPVVNDVLTEANRDLDRIKAALKGHDVDEKDMQTSNLSINPFWDNNRINGYQVTQTLTVKLRDLGKAGQAISDAATAGGNSTRINGVSFDIEDNVKLVEAARENAFADAKKKAEQYAQLAGRSLGRVSQINESTEYSSQPPMPYYARDMAAGSAEKMAVPVSPGQQQVSVNTSVVWELN
ncbi:MAG: SIMPL domain-containing protein [Sporichthyaceae bacterium]